jgi:hypothetical protein
MAIKPAGYIVADANLIHGTGKTAEAAVADAMNALAAARVTIIDENHSTDWLYGAWQGSRIRASDFKTIPATVALIEDVHVRGGACGWFEAGGVACTKAEWLASVR